MVVIIVVVVLLLIIIITIIIISNNGINDSSSSTTTTTTTNNNNKNTINKRGRIKRGRSQKPDFANWLQNRPQKYVSVVALCQDVSPGKHQECNRFGVGGIKRPFWYDPV